MLGIDPLMVGNKGKIIIGVPELAEDVLKNVKMHSEGQDAFIVGNIKSRDEQKGVVLETFTGGKGIVDAPAGDPVPRIC